MELQIEIKGKATSNIVEYKKDILKAIEAHNKELKTDEDFAEAENIVKICKAKEKELEASKKQAFEQTASISDLMAAIDEISGTLRTTRLSLDKQIKAQKEAVRESMIDKATDDIMNLLTDGCRYLKIKTFPLGMDWYSEVKNSIKGKSVLSKMQQALDKEVHYIKSEIKVTTERIEINISTLEACENQGLFPDRQHLICMEFDQLDKEIENRELKEKIRLQELAERKRKEVEDEKIRLQELEKKVHEIEEIKETEQAKESEEFYNRPQPEAEEEIPEFLQEAETKETYQITMKGTLFQAKEVATRARLYDPDTTLGVK